MIRKLLDDFKIVINTRSNEEVLMSLKSFGFTILIIVCLAAWLLYNWQDNEKYKSDNINGIRIGDDISNVDLSLYSHMEPSIGSQSYVYTIGNWALKGSTYIPSGSIFEGGQINHPCIGQFTMIMAGKSELPRDGSQCFSIALDVNRKVTSVVYVHVFSDCVVGKALPNELVSNEVWKNNRQCEQKHHNIN
jgi:hypothetical protein